MDSGGIRSEPSSQRRRIISLCSGCPGTKGRSPVLAGESADSRRSSRRPPLRVASSGPWHLKQNLASRGRTSEAKSGAWTSGKIPNSKDKRGNRFIAWGLGRWEGFCFIVPSQGSCCEGLSSLDCAPVFVIRPGIIIPGRVFRKIIPFCKGRTLGRLPVSEVAFRFVVCRFNPVRSTKFLKFP